jgi:hypothetical protein
MKKLVSIIILCLGCLGFTEAQETYIWKSVYLQGSFLGVSHDGSIFAHDGSNGLIRSQDEGETWQVVLGQETGFSGFVNPSCFAVSNEGRICVYNDNQQAVVYSDDNGNTWQQMPQVSSCAMTNVVGLYAPSNETVVGWASTGELFWTTDGGETWDGTIPDFMVMENAPTVSDLLVNENGDVYISISTMDLYDYYVWHSTLSDMQNWEPVAFNDVNDVNIQDMEFDPEGNVVVCGWSTEGSIGFQHVPGFYLFDGTSLAVSNSGIVYKMNNSTSITSAAVLAYSYDHGETFTEIGNELYYYQPAPGEDASFLVKGYDNYLYFNAEGNCWKSIPDASSIPTYNPWVGEKILDEASGLYYILTSDSTARVTYFDTDLQYYSGDVTIPSSIVYGDWTYTVNEIGDMAFVNCPNLTSVTIPNTVTSIGVGAFSNTGLVSITIPDSVESIGEGLFVHCPDMVSVTLSDAITGIPDQTFRLCSSLASVTLSSHLTTIGNRAFEGCGSLASITLPDGLQAIESSAFYNSGLTSIDIPNSVTTLGGSAFGLCDSLAEVHLSESMTVIEDHLFYNCGNMRSVSIPSQLVKIGNSAFYQCYNLEEVLIPATVTTIGGAAFQSCYKLNSVSIPATLTYLGDAAFSECTSLTSATLPEGLDTIPQYLFSSCHSLASITIPESVVAIEESAFYGCDSLQTVYIPQNVEMIGDGAFSYCHGLETIELDPNNDRFKIVDGVLFNPSKTILMLYPAGRRANSYAIPSSVDTIANQSFAGANYLTEVVIPNSVTLIGVSAFNRCNGLHSVTIPTGNIGWNAFYGCESLETVYVGHAVDRINYRAFMACDNLRLVILGNPNVFIDGEAFQQAYPTGEMALACLGNTPSSNVAANVFPYNTEAVMTVPCGMTEAYNNVWGYQVWFGHFEDDCNQYNISVVGNENGNQVAPSVSSVMMGDEVTFDVTLEPSYVLNSIVAYKTDDETLKVPVVDNRFVMPNFDVTVVADFEYLPIGEGNPEWYYEIQNENGSVTYQHLEYAADTTVNHKDVTIIIRTNTLYDKDGHSEVTREYVYEEDDVVYWWNKDLEEFTVLYDFGAQEGDSWVIKVGTETLTMHVDAVELYEYKGKLFRMLQVSDDEDLFSGTIVGGIGHLTSFFPEKLMTRGKNFRVEGIRCYWREGELVFKYGEEDCDAMYEKYHHGIGEDGPSTGSGILTVYPNPTDGVLFVETRRATSLPAANEYHIANLMGQTVQTGNLNAETQQINVSGLPQGMYFISLGDMTRKFVVR